MLQSIWCFSLRIWKVQYTVAVCCSLELAVYCLKCAATFIRYISFLRAPSLRNLLISREKLLFHCKCAWNFEPLKIPSNSKCQTGLSKQMKKKNKLPYTRDIHILEDYNRRPVVIQNHKTLDTWTTQRMEKYELWNDEEHTAKKVIQNYEKKHKIYSKKVPSCCHCYCCYFRSHSCVRVLFLCIGLFNCEA